MHVFEWGLNYSQIHVDSLSRIALEEHHKSDNVILLNSAHLLS